MHDEHIVYCYLEDFYYGEPALVFIAKEREMRKFRDILVSFSSQKEAKVELSDISPFRSIKGAKVYLTCAPQSAGMKRLSEESSNQFLWILSKQHLDTFADLLDGLARSGGSGHQYLDTNGCDDITVIASMNEYDPDRLQD